MNDYAGNPAVFPVTIPLIDDSDPPDASHFAPTGEALADRTAYLYALSLMFINGVTGGTYAPSAPIIIGGAGIVCPNGSQWELDGNLYLDGTGAFTPTVTFDGAGATALWQGGALAKFDSTSGWEMLNGAHSTMLNGSLLTLQGTVVIGATGSIVGTSAGAGALLINGNVLEINDGTDPTYVTPRTRTIAQPMAFAEVLSNTYFAVAEDSVTDKFSGGKGWYRLTKLVNGAQLAQASIFVKYTAHGAPASAATAALIRTDVTTGTSLTLKTVTINTTAGASQTVSLAPTATEIINDALYAYSIEMTPEQSTGAQAIQWFPPTVQHTAISAARSI